MMFKLHYDSGLVTLAELNIKQGDVQKLEKAMEELYSYEGHLSPECIWSNDLGVIVNLDGLKVVTPSYDSEHQDDDRVDDRERTTPNSDSDEPTPSLRQLVLRMLHAGDEPAQLRAAMRVAMNLRRADNTEICRTVGALQGWSLTPAASIEIEKAAFEHDVEPKVLAVLLNSLDPTARTALQVGLLTAAMATDADPDDIRALGLAFPCLDKDAKSEGAKRLLQLLTTQTAHEILTAAVEAACGLAVASDAHTRSLLEDRLVDVKDHPAVDGRMIKKIFDFFYEVDQRSGCSQ